MIGANSRYRSAITQVVTGPNEDVRTEMRPAFPQSRVMSFTYYRVTGGDRIDTISNAYFGSGALWWKIADANPEVMDWFDLTPGLIIRIPNG